jgi:hypothetical protein
MERITIGRFARGSAAASGNRLTLATALVVVLMTVLLGASYAWFVPLQTDGGWYSYPGYALSQGRDPSENLFPGHQLARESSGVRAAFGWELRSFLIVPLHAAWFVIAGTSLVSLKVFGILQWLAVTGLVGFAVWLATGDRFASSVAALAAMSDSWLISESMADLRPDVPIAVAAVCCLVATLKYADSQRWHWLATASIAAASLPLLHTTGVLALAFCGSMAGVLAIAPRSDAAGRRWEMLFIGAGGVLTFLFKQDIVDVLLPTTLPEAAQLPFRDDLSLKLQELLAGGLMSKLGMEAARWFDYLLVSNAAHLLFLGIGFYGVVVTGFRSENQDKQVFHVALITGSAIGIAAFLANPHHWPSHIVPVAALLYIVSGVGLGGLPWATRSTFLRRSFVALGLLVALLRAGHCYELVRSSVTEGVSNKSLVQFISATLEPGVSRLAIAPTLIWPYVEQTRSVVLIDPGARMWEPTDPRWPSITTVILDRDLMARGWSAFATTMTQCGAFEKKGSLGRSSGGGFYLEAYAVIRPPCIVSSSVSSSGNGVDSSIHVFPARAGPLE